MAVTTRNGEVRYQAYDLLNKDLTPMVAQVHARSIEEFGDFHRHDGEEFVYVLDGELAFYSDSYTPAYLKAGDSIYFDRSEEHTSELQSLMRISYAVFCLYKNIAIHNIQTPHHILHYTSKRHPLTHEYHAHQNI